MPRNVSGPGLALARSLLSLQTANQNTDNTVNSYKWYQFISRTLRKVTLRPPALQMAAVKPAGGYYVRVMMDYKHGELDPKDDAPLAESVMKALSGMWRVAK